MSAQARKNESTIAVISDCSKCIPTGNASWPDAIRQRQIALMSLAPRLKQGSRRNHFCGLPSSYPQPKPPPTPQPKPKPPPHPNNPGGASCLPVPRHVQAHGRHPPMPHALRRQVGGRLSGHVSIMIFTLLPRAGFHARASMAACRGTFPRQNPRLPAGDCQHGRPPPA